MYIHLIWVSSLGEREIRFGGTCIFVQINEINLREIRVKYINTCILAYSNG